MVGTLTVSPRTLTLQRAGGGSIGSILIGAKNASVSWSMTKGANGKFIIVESSKGKATTGSPRRLSIAVDPETPESVNKVTLTFMPGNIKVTIKIK
ncbi:MAG: hypothetical protein HZY75_13505 [Nocardioidaceae bacterium]|nr:MAG: hypothetical protein HZY75_13505 [Nocardioidaceae bacterium]